MANSVDVPKPGEWPGVFEAYKIVKPFIKPKIWDFVSVLGIGIVIALIIRIILSAIFKSAIMDTVIADIVGIFVGAFLQASLISMFFDALKGKDFTVNSALNYGLNNLLKMTGLIIVMYVVLVASFILLVIPFFFVLPRVCLAPYYLVKENTTISDALSLSWNNTKGNARWVWGILLLYLAASLLAITIIGIPFAIYWGIIISGCFALISLYLAQGSKTKKAKATS